MTPVITILLNFLEKVLNWASPFFLGKTLERKKWVEGTRDAVDTNTSERAKIHRENVISSDATSTRDELREWTRRDN